MLRQWKTTPRYRKKHEQASGELDKKLAFSMRSGSIMLKKIKK